MTATELENIMREGMEAAASICDAEAKKALSQQKLGLTDELNDSVNLYLRTYALGCQMCAESIRKALPKGD